MPSLHSYRTVLVKIRTRTTHEFQAGAAGILPGHLLRLSTTLGDVLVDNGAAGATPTSLWAIEDLTQGRGISDAYADNDRVLCYYGLPGDIIFPLVETGAVLTQGVFLESAGDGTLQVRTTGKPIAVSLDVFTASGAERAKVMLL